MYSNRLRATQSQKRCRAPLLGCLLVTTALVHLVVRPAWCWRRTELNKMTTNESLLSDRGGAAGKPVRALFDALDELMVDGMIEYPSYSHRANGKWTITLQPAEGCAGKFNKAMNACVMYVVPW